MTLDLETTGTTLKSKLEMVLPGTSRASLRWRSMRLRSRSASSSSARIDSSRAAGQPASLRYRRVRQSRTTSVSSPASASRQHQRQFDCIGRMAAFVRLALMTQLLAAAAMSHSFFKYTVLDSTCSCGKQLDRAARANCFCISSTTESVPCRRHCSILRFANCGREPTTTAPPADRLAVAWCAPVPPQTMSIRLVRKQLISVDPTHQPSACASENSHDDN